MKTLGKLGWAQGVLTLLVLSLTPFAVAQVEGPALENAFVSTDRDNNNALDYEEYRLRIIETFYLLDADKDGNLVITEIDIVEREIFPSVDRNDNEQIDLEEFLHHRHGHFQRADSDSDGQLSAEEVSSTM